MTSIGPGLSATEDTRNDNLEPVCWSIIAAWLSKLFEAGQVVELRAIPPNGAPVSRLYDFDRFGAMAQYALELTASSKFKGVYITLNPLQPDSLGRSGAASDCDVLRRRLLLIDVDPKRPGGCSATNEEKAKAKAKILLIRERLRQLNWPEPVLADSGNGFHLLYRIDLPVDDGGLVKRVLRALAEEFDDESVEVDRRVYNPSRITKLYGTQACKGTCTAERPHRWTAVLEMPMGLKNVSRELLESLAGPLPESSLAPMRNDCPCEVPITNVPSLPTTRDKQDQARAYLTKIPGAIEGKGGDKSTWTVACYLVVDFDLSIEDAMPVFCEWNQRCVPPWAEKDLRRKLEIADKKVNPRGRLLANRPSKKEPTLKDASHDMEVIENVFPIVIPDFFQWDRAQATPMPSAPCRDKLGRVNKGALLSHEWALDIVRHAVVAQRCSQVLLPDTYLAKLIWGAKDLPANWRQTIARALWSCAPDILPLSNQFDYDEEFEEKRKIVEEQEWRLGERDCFSACPFYGRRDLPHRHFRVALSEESWGVMRSFISEKIGEHCVEFDFRNVKWTKAEVDARKHELKEELKGRKMVLKDPIDPYFNRFLAEMEIKAVERELRTLKVGRHRVREVLAHYLPIRIFGPSPQSGLAPAQCSILKAFPMQLTRASRNNDRADKALVIHFDPTADCIQRYPVPIYPGLDRGDYVMFNGNATYRRYRRHGYGFKIATWMRDAGYPATAKIRRFFLDVKNLPQQFGLMVFGWNRFDRKWCTLDQMLSMCRCTVGQKWLTECVLRVYAKADYLTCWRQYFAVQMGFTAIPGGESEDMLPLGKRETKRRITIRSGHDLQAWMTKNGLSDGQLAKSLGVNRATVALYRTGYRPWSPRFQAKLEAYTAGLET